MKSLKKWLVITIITLYLPMSVAQSPVGRWTTIDDKTGQKGAVVKLIETGDTLTGTILWAYPEPGDKNVCSKCPGDFKDKPIKGLQFLWGLKDRGDGIWDGGSILDARTGKIYHAKVTVKGDKLYVRGYVGMPLLGRTQVWVR